MSNYTQTKNNVKPLCCIKRVWNGLDDDDDDDDDDDSMIQWFNGSMIPWFNDSMMMMMMMMMIMMMMMVVVVMVVVYSDFGFALLVQGVSLFLPVDGHISHKESRETGDTRTTTEETGSPFCNYSILQ